MSMLSTWNRSLILMLVAFSLTQFTAKAECQVDPDTEPADVYGTGSFISCEDDCLNQRDADYSAAEDAYLSDLVSVHSIYDQAVDDAYNTYLTAASNCYDFTCVLDALSTYESAVQTAESNLDEDLTDALLNYLVALDEADLDYEICLLSCGTD
ncbi:MAG: hypothetical protein Phyf2KO_00740 [Phycisphaerales bacterium]